MSDKTTRILHEAGRPVLKKRRRFALAGPGGRMRTFDAPRVRLGSHPDGDLVIDEPTVSRLHAQITVDETGWRIVDLDSTNGVLVDELRVRDAYLPSSCTIRLGKADVHFRVEPSEVDVPLAAEERLGGLLGRSALMRELFDRMHHVAKSDATVLVQGETGSGKEEVASTLHALGGRCAGPFVIFDCAAVSTQLIESELFGHERGAFTGATNRHLGAVEEAEGGTLFLDEVGELPLEMQQKLLRLLERGDYRRLGGAARRNADVRIIAATHRDLAREVGRGRFREDLYFRLAVIELEVPPLRRRTEDLELLVEHFVREERAGRDEAQRVLDRLDERTWERLRAHRWPGNVRELRNLVKRFLVFGSGLDPSERRSPTPPKTRAEPPRESVSDPIAVDGTRPWMDQKRELVARLEAAYLQRALVHADGNITRAAANAGIERMYFKRLCKKHGVL